MERAIRPVKGFLRVPFWQVDGKLICRSFYRSQVVHILHPGVEIPENGVVLLILLFGKGCLQPAKQPDIPGLLCAACQMPPTLGGHLGNEQVSALPASSAAVVADEDDLIQQRREHGFQRVQRPSACRREQDALLCQRTDDRLKIRRKPAGFVQKGSVHIRRDQANAIHFPIPHHPM